MNSLWSSCLHNGRRSLMAREIYMINARLSESNIDTIIPFSLAIFAIEIWKNRKSFSHGNLEIIGTEICVRDDSRNYSFWVFRVFFFLKISRLVFIEAEIIFSLVELIYWNRIDYLVFLLNLKL